MAELKNRQAYHEYFIDAKYEAGMVLQGTEVKSLREGRASFNDSYCLIHKGEIWLKKLYDKRESIKQKDVQREMKRFLK